MINRLVVIGRLTAEPELRYTQNGHPNTRFSLACERPVKSQDGSRITDFIPVVTWGKLAEICAKYLSTGLLCGCSGRLQVNRYTAKDGSKRTGFELVADEVQFLQRSKTKPQENDPNEGEGEGENDAPIDDVPF